MIAGIVDTNILIELYRNLPAAKTWIAAQTDLAISSVSWLEFMEGARGKAGQAHCLAIIAPFAMVYLTDADQQWAMEQLLRYRLSYGLQFQDCLIASAAHRLHVPLYTRNARDFQAMLPAPLVVKPY
jgi:predicted nucleic acid-binding protein